jgi:pimeloyl-ACP methyl ester carboxylesterase
LRVEVNGIRLWFDVDGPGLVVDGATMRRRPTVVLVHGGPGGFDHAYFKPDFGRLAECAQVVYLDLRDHGRSTWGEVAGWNLELCADDVRAFCETLGIQRPVVLGHSMGAPIVLLYGARHPGHAAGLVVQSGFARWDHARLVQAFRRVGGDQVADLADRAFRGEEVGVEEWDRVYRSYGVRLPDEARRSSEPQNLALNGPGMELLRRLDIVDQLGRIESDVLVSVGELDPVTPVGAAEELCAALPAERVRLDVVPGAGHFTWLDAPDHYWPALFDFVTGVPRD